MQLSELTLLHQLPFPTLMRNMHVLSLAQVLELVACKDANDHCESPVVHHWPRSS